jgi:hypothetical protein
MNQPDPFQILVLAIVVMAPIILGLRRLAGSGPSAIETLFRGWRPDPWPRGIQEEEPMLWNVRATEAPRPYGASVTPMPRTEPARDARGTRALGHMATCAPRSSRRRSMTSTGRS